MNGERNRKLYELWETGHTLRHAALLAGVPEGTVAYYYRKFNRAGRSGKPILIDSQIGDPNASKIELVSRGLDKIYLQTKIEEMLQKGNIEAVNQVMEFYGKIKKMDLGLTQQEFAALVEALYTTKEQAPTVGQAPTNIFSVSSPKPDHDIKPSPITEQSEESKRLKSGRYDLPIGTFEELH